MARVLEFSGTLIVTDIEVSLGEGDGKTVFKGHAMRDGRYSFWQVDVLEPKLVERSPEREFAEEIVKATAVYEATVYEARKKLELDVREANKALARSREKAAEAAASGAAAAADAE